MWDQTVVREEMWAHHEPRGAQYMGLNWVGPAIMAFGTDAQKALHLPRHRRRRRDLVPGVQRARRGSDLASLSTKAAPRSTAAGAIDGQKIWTSYAEMAQWCVLAARAGTRASRSTRASRCSSSRWTRPGITVRPIRSSLGPHHLNEVFFDDVVVDDDDGARRRRATAGRSIRHALAFERVGHRAVRALRPPALGARGASSATLRRAARDTVRASWMRALVAVRVARLLAYRVVHLQAEGTPADTAASVARIAVTQADQLVAEALFQALDSAQPARQGAAARCCTARSRTTTATRRPRRSRRAPSRSSA